MAAPLEEVVAFVRTSSIGGGRALDVAIVFAESMLRELQATLDEWERTARALRDERDVRKGLPLETAADPGTRAKVIHAAN